MERIPFKGRIMEIRIASLADAPLLARIISTANMPIAREFSLNQENTPRHPSFCTRDWIEDGFKRGEYYFVCEVAGKAAGCVAYASPEREIAFLNRLAVLPEFQGQGIGRGLVHHLFAHARAKKKTIVSIGIIAANLRLKTWYETLGFMPHETKTFDHLPFDVLLMQHHLIDSGG